MREWNLAILPLSLPRSDYKCHIRKLIREAWQRLWTNIGNNKLRQLLPTIARKYTDSHPRSWSVKMTRLRLGHTCLTHEFLMSRAPRPCCDYCDEVPLTVRHIRIECPNYNRFRHIFVAMSCPSSTPRCLPTDCGYGGPRYSFLRLIGVLDGI